jgi:hypothetical protein
VTQCNRPLAREGYHENGNAGLKFFEEQIRRGAAGNEAEVDTDAIVSVRGITAAMKQRGVFGALCFSSTARISLILKRLVRERIRGLVAIVLCYWSHQLLHCIKRGAG